MLVDMNDKRRSNNKTSDTLSCLNVFILATGFESSLNTLCENIPKCLLKIANKPILAYQLEFLERNKINEVNILTNKKFYQQIYDYLYGQYSGNIKFDIISTSKNLESLEVFPLIKKLSANNFMILSADSILDFNITDMIDNHVLNNSLVSLALCKDDQKFVNQRLKYINKEIEIDIFGLNEVNKKNPKDPYKQLVYHTRIYDDNEREARIKLPTKIIKNCPNFDLIYNYEDINLYIFNRKIFSIFDDEKVKKLVGIKTDLIPFLINNYFNRKLKKQIYGTETLSSTTSLQETENLAIKKSKSEKIKIMAYVLEGKNYVWVTNLNKLLNTIGEFQKSVEEIPTIYFFTRNNLKNVFQNFSGQINKNINSDRPYFEGLDYIESITLDSLVADPVSLIAKKSRINKSVVGTNLYLEANSKISYSLIFDNVKIGKDCKITNCIIGDNVTIEDSCNLTDCVVFPLELVNRGTEVTNDSIGGES